MPASVPTTLIDGELRRMNGVHCLLIAAFVTQFWRTHSMRREE